MKNYLIVFLMVVILALTSIIYKNSKSSIYDGFPLKKISTADVDAPLFLYVFFSKNNCRDCMQVIELLNILPIQYRVVGVVPENELEKESELRSMTKAEFPLISIAKYKKYIPPYAPSILGISRKGKIYFILPGVPKAKEYLQKFLDEFHHKVYPSLIQLNEIPHP